LKQPTCGEVLHLLRLTFIKPDADDLISALLAPIPRTMEGDKKISLVLLPPAEFLFRG
jgi:hypothetical protein